MRTQTLLRCLRAGVAACEAGIAGAAQQRAAALLTASSSRSAVRALASLATRQPEAVYGFALPQGRGISTSASSSAEAVTEVAVDGDVNALLKAIDAAVSSETSTAKDVADAAVALAYVQAKGARRVWGKVFERASAVKGEFDAASLTNFLWAATTAGVEHFKTIFELAGPAAALLKSFTPTQLSIVVEALGKAGAADVELFAKIADQVAADAGKFSGSELARILYGFASASNQNDGKLAKAAAAALVSKADSLGAREAVQAVYALAKLGRADKAALDALVKSAKGKLAGAESPVDAAALAWSLGFIGYKPDSETKSALASVLKGSASALTPAHAIDAAWGLSLIGGDAATISALLGSAASAVEKAPESLDVFQLGALYTAAVVADVKLPESVLSFAGKAYSLGADHARSKRSAAMSAFKTELAEATALATGARYRPEVAAAVKSFTKSTADGITVDIAVELDGTKVAVEAVGPYYLSSAGSLLGPAVARAKLLEARGYKVASVPLPEFAAQKDSKAKAAYLLKAISAAAPGTKSAVNALAKKLDEPFNAYSD